MITVEQLHPNLKALTPNQFWLLQHQVTAFWHGFGISNGLDVPRNMIIEDPYNNKSDNEKFVRVKAEYMREQLEDYVKWLKSYRETWNSNEPHLFGIHTIEKFLEDERDHESREKILEMISLLQDGPNISFSACMKMMGNEKYCRELKKGNTYVGMSNEDYARASS